VVGSLLEDAGLDEILQPIRQEIRRDAREAMEKLVVPPGPLEKLAHDEEDPAVADDIETAGEAAVLAI
jgi:hypothetical protein